MSADVTTRRMPPASRVALALQCLYPWTSGATWPAKGPRTASQRYGDAFHELAEKIAREHDPTEGSSQGPLPIEDWASDIAEKHGLTEGEDRALLGDAVHIVDVLDADHVQGPRHVEVAACFDPFTGQSRMLTSTDRAEPHEVYARADVAFWRTDGVFVIRDWKTGERARQERPRDMAQLRVLALAFAGSHRATLHVEIAHVGECGIEIVGDDLTAEDLRETEGVLLDLEDRLAQPAEPRQGPWCERGYCPMRATCPATLEALASVDRELTVWPLRGPLAGPEHAAFLRHRLPALKAWIEERERAIEAEAKRAPLPVPGKEGMFWGPIEHPGREKIKLSPEAKETLVAELPLTHHLAIEESTSKASIERAIRAQVLKVHGGQKLPRGAAKQLTDKVFRLLREEGAIVKGAKYVRYQEFKKIGDAVIAEPESEGDHG